jgi:hypothetical protein
VTSFFYSHFLDLFRIVESTRPRGGSFVLDVCPLPFDGRSPYASRGQRVEKDLCEAYEASVCRHDARRIIPYTATNLHSSSSSSAHRHQPLSPLWTSSCLLLSHLGSLTCAQVEKKKKPENRYALSPQRLPNFSLRPYMTHQKEVHHRRNLAYSPPTRQKVVQRLNVRDDSHAARKHIHESDNWIYVPNMVIWCWLPRSPQARPRRLLAAQKNVISPSGPDVSKIPAMDS